MNGDAIKQIAQMPLYEQHSRGRLREKKKKEKEKKGKSNLL